MERVGQSKKRVGILGGTFNPIHNGHLHLARKAMEEQSLEQVLFIPSGVSYMKDQSQILPAAQRAQMVLLAIRDNPCFALSAVEIEKTGNSYTDETIRTLQSREPGIEFFFLTGADTVYSMENWKNPAGIFSAVTILAACRPGVPMEALKEKITQLQLLYRADIRLMDAGEVDISSSKIREAVAEGSSIRGLVPPAVEAYIAEHHLYRREDIERERAGKG